MALADALGATDPQSVVNDLIAQAQPDLAGSAVDPQSVMNRLIRKHTDERQQRDRTRASPPPAQNFDAFGPTADEVAKTPPVDFSQFGQSDEEKPAAAPPAAPRDATADFRDAQATVASIEANGPPAAAPSTAPKEEWPGYLETAKTAPLHHAVTQAGAQLKGLASNLSALTPSIVATGGGEGVPLQAEPLPMPDPRQNPIYKAGESVEKYGRETFPLSKTQQESVTGRVTGGLGAFAGMAPGMLAGGAVGGAPGAIAAGAAQMGLAASGDTFTEAIEKGATPEQAAKAAGLSGIASGALGAVPLGTVLRPVMQTAPGLAGFAAAKLEHALQSGIAFVSIGEVQEYLAREIASNFYDPKAKYEPDVKRVVASLLTGGILSAAAPTHIEPQLDAFLKEARAQPAREEGAPPFGTARGAKWREEIDEFLRSQEAAKQPGGPAGLPKPETEAAPEGAAPQAEPARSQADREGDFLIRAGHDPADIVRMSPEERSAALAQAAKDLGEPAPQPEGTRDAPVELKTAEDLARASEVINQDHSPRQGEANNVQRGHVVWPPNTKGALDITLEAPAGGVRRGTAPNGEPFETRHAFAYGYFKGVPMGADKQAPDVTIGDHPTSPTAFVIDEVDPETGRFRQTKSFVAFQTPQQAIDAYLGMSSKDKSHFGGMRAFPAAELVDIAKAGGLAKPVSDSMVAKEKARTESVLPEEPGSDHHQAIDAALKSVGEAPHGVRPADLARAAEIHATEGAPPDQAFTVAVLRSLVEDGHITPDALKQVIGDAAAKDILEASGGPQRRLRAETHGAAAGGQAPAEPGELGAGGAEARAQPSRQAAETAERAGGQGSAAAAGHPEGGRGAPDHAAGGLEAAGPAAGRASGPAGAGGGAAATHGNAGAATKAALIGRPVPAIPEHAVTDASGTKVQVEPVVVEASHLITSSDQGYDKTLQPRERERAASQAQIREIATRLDPERLGYSAEADRGAPIVGPDRMVESGNGRIHALRALYRAKAPNAERYRDWLKSQGVDVGRYKEPILVRQRLSDLDSGQRRAFTVAANQASTLAMSAPERALADARRLTPDMLGQIADGSNLGAAENRAFMRAFVASIPASERGSLANAEGALSAEGLTRAKNAVLAKAYGDADIVSRITESTDDEIRSISNALTAAAPQWAKLKADIEAGRVRRDLDLTDDLMEAVKRTADLRARGEKLEAYLAQNDAFDHLKGPVEGFMRWFYDPQGRRSASAQRIAEKLRFYADQAAKVTNDPDLGLDIPKVKPDDIQRAASAQAEHLQPGVGEGVRPGVEAGGTQARGREAGAGGAGTAEVEPQRGFAESRGRFKPPAGPDLFGHTERTAAGEQAVLPGAERISERDLAERRGAKPLKPKAEQKPADHGLFGEPGRQADLVEAAALKPAEPSPHIEGKEPSRGSESDRVRQAAPEVPPGQPAGRVRATPQKRGAASPSLFDWEPGERDVRAPAGAEEQRPGSAEPPVPREGTQNGEPRAGGERGGDEGPHQPRPVPRRLRGLGEANQKIAERSRLNYRITDDDKIGEGGARQKVRANLEAIRTLKAIEDESRQPTPEEKRILVKYVGWGSVAQEMFDTARHSPHAEKWKVERDTLRTLLTDAEYDAARASTPNAHYTSPDVVRGIWDALDHLGFKGGMALEPAAGVGHFIGMIPDKLAPKTSWTATELDQITGRIAHKLYGGAEVNVQGFEELKRPSNHYDMAVSNVPFGNYNISEKPYGSFPIHDFFFVKALDKVRPGGVVAFITSRYTLDRTDPATRRLLGRTADLVGAIRLPGGKKGAFAGNAGTEVTTDILFLRKKIPGEAPFQGADWTNLKEIKTPDGPVSINEYFADHPKMMLGEMRLQGTQYRADEPVLIGEPEGLREKIAEAAKAMRSGAFMKRSTAPPPDTIHGSEISGLVKDGAFFMKDGKLYQRRHGEGFEQRLSADDHDRVRRLVGMRDAVNDLLGAQLQPGGNLQARATETGVLRQHLNAAYKAFVAKHGPINREVRTVTSRLDRQGEPITVTRQPNLKAFMADPDAWKVAAIENYDGETDTAKPAAILLRDVIDPPRQRQINGPGDALAAALDDTGSVDLDHIGNSLGLDSHEAVVGTLGDMVYLDPDGRKWETADQYLSGDVVKKLEDAKALAQDDSGYLRNVAALEKVQPTPLTRADIVAQFGAPWVPAEVYKDFLTDALGAKNAAVARVPITGEWRVNVGHASPDAVTKFGTDRVGLDKIVDAALNNRQVTVYDRGAEDKAVVNQPATEQARIKTELLKEAFTGDHEAGVDGWAFADDERAKRLEAIYNRTYNNLVPRKFDGTHLTLPGLNPMFTDRQHRRDAVWRMVQAGNTLLAHVVGSGKTVTMIAGGMEMKRLGLINKPAYVVPNHMLEQFSREFLQAYPNAKILVAQKDEMTRDRRKEFLAKVAANDWDGVIITHDAFGRINMGKEFREGFIRDQMDELERVLRAEKEGAGKNSPTVKGLERAKKKLEDKLDKLMNEERKDEGTSFEESGIDHLFVDEAHKFKNLAFITRMQRVKGLAQGNSQRAEDLFLKIRYLEQKRPGRSAVFATGTPVSNTMAELWTMQRYLQLEKLRERDLDTFDAWASTFGRVVNNMELSADGRTLKEVSSFSKFVNVPELISLYSEVADTKTADMLKLPRPEVRRPDGVPGIEIVEANPSAQEEAYIQELVKLAEELKGKKPRAGEPNMLSVVTRGRKVATDGRLIAGDYDFNPEGKIAKAVANIHDIWRDGKEPGTVQMVFLDLGVPQSRRAAKAKPRPETEDASDDMGDPAQAEAQRINLYSDIKQRLVEKGIPANQIAFIHDATDDAKKAKLFAAVRAGKVRLILGSSEKMGVGTNAQDRLIAMHHLDAPWKPAEVEQRDGRIVRQGNLNKNVRILRYVTRRSFDAFMWQKLDTKSKFIAQVLSGAKGSRHAEDIDNPLPEAAEMKAAASGDPRILEHAEIDRAVRQLTAQRRAFDQTKSRADWELGAAKSRINTYETALPDAKIDAAKVHDIAADRFTADVLGATYTDRREAGVAILRQLLAPDQPVYYSPKLVNVGTLSGFDMNVKLAHMFGGGEPRLEAEFSLKGAKAYGSPSPLVINPQTDPFGVIRRFENVLASVKQQPARLETQIADERDSVARLERTLKETWPKEADYRAAIAKRDALEMALKATADKPAEPALIEAGGRAGKQRASGIAAVQDKFLHDKGLTWELAASLDARHLAELEKEWARRYPGNDKPLVDVEHFRPSQIKADPERFQYRDNVVDKTSGVTDKPMRPGWVQTAPMVVWESRSGEHFIADGHHRLNRAQEMEKAGEKVNLAAIVLREANGITPEIARDFGQRRNEWRERNLELRRNAPDLPALLNGLQANSSAGMPSRAASSGGTGVQAPGMNSSGVASPGTQPAPSFQDSTRAVPSDSLTTRDTPPSIFEGPAITVRFPDLALGDIDPSSNKNILQGSDDYKALLAAAEENKPRFANRLQEIAGEIPGARFSGARVKDLAGLEEKIAAKKSRAPSTFSDYLGARVVVDTPAAMHAFIDRLERLGGVIEAENFVSPGKDGYRAYHVQVGLGDGTSAEIQLVPRDVADVMEAAHDVRQPVKRLDLSDPAQVAKYEQVMAGARKIFDDAWAKASPDWRGYEGREGLAEGSAWRRPPASHVAFQADRRRPLGEQAQSFVLERGRLNGDEHLIAIDHAGRIAMTLRGTSDFIRIDDEQMRVLDDPASSIVIHHNHPSDAGLSSVDIGMLGRPGVAAIWAHGHNGNVARMALTPQAKEMFNRLGTPEQVNRALFRVASGIEGSLYEPLQNAILANRISIDEAKQTSAHALGLALARGDIVDYRANTDVARIIENLKLEPYIRFASDGLKESFNVPIRDDRSADALRHAGDVGAVFRPSGGAPGENREQGGPARARPALDRAEAAGQIRLPGFAEDSTRFREPPRPGPGGAGPPPPPGATAAPPARRPTPTGVQRITHSALAKTFKHFWTSTFQPELFSDRALEADPLFARYKASSAQEKDAVVKQSESEWEYWNKRPDAERLPFLDAMERGATPADPAQANMARRYRVMLDRNWAEEKRYGSQASFVQDYFPHIWERPDDFRAFSEARSAQVGPTWFQKKRTFDYIEEGLAAGLKLKYTNPVDIVVHRLMSGVDMRQRMDLLHKLKDLGLAWEGAQGGEHLVRRGWRLINAPDRKQWVIAPDVQYLWKNGVDAKGLWQAEHPGGSVFRGWMVLKNAWVPIKLALSAFHPIHVLHINYSNGMAQAWDDVVKGRDPVSAIKAASRGFLGPMQAAPGATGGAVAGAVLGSTVIPVGPYWGALGGSVAGAITMGAAKRLGLRDLPHPGKSARAAWAKRPSQQTPEEKAAVALMTDGGFVPQLSEQLKINAKRQMAEAFQKIARREAGASDWRKFVSAAMRRPMEKLQAPIFEAWIPALKTAAYLDAASSLLRRRPELLDDDTERRIALRAIAKSIDNRYGEMFYGNLFWNRTLKDALIGSFLSLGWNLGFVREFGGAVMEGATRPAGLFPPFRPGAGRKTIRNATNKIAFAIAYMGSFAIINGMMTYLFTGEKPEGLDYIFARVGGTNPEGSPRRITNMSYLREVPMLLKHVQERGGNWLTGAGEMLWNKLMFEPFHELLNNRDYFGYNIWDENAPIYKQIWQGVKHTFAGQTPMSVSGARHALDSGGTWKKDVPLSFMGFGPAPAYVEKSAIQNRIAYLFHQHVAPVSKPEEEGQTVPERMRVRSAILLAKQNKDQSALQEAFRKGKEIGMKQDYMSKVGVTPTDMYLFSRLPNADQKAILDMASPEEAKRYLPRAHLSVKIEFNRRAAAH